MAAKIIVLSGPGGVGKNTIYDALLTSGDKRLTSITKLTTRAIRPHERDGHEFHFISREAFEAAIESGELLEHNLFNGNYYGVPKAPLESALSANLCPVLVIDVNGGRAVRAAYPKDSLLVFITAPLAELKVRYMARGQSKSEAETRLKIAVEQELPLQSDYDAIVENDDGQLDQTIAQIRALIDEALSE